MASSLNAATSGGGGVIVTSDASGDLNIQSGGSTVVAVTSTGVAVSGTLSATGDVTFTKAGADLDLNLNSTGGSGRNWAFRSDNDGRLLLIDKTAVSGRAEWDSAGLCSLNAGLAVTGLVDISAATSGQIKFPATQNASANANTLDDYEEGTWTPTINFSGGAGTLSYSARVGTYTKIGNTLFFNMRLVVNKGTAAGTLDNITGLPFSATTYSAGGGVYIDNCSVLSGGCQYAIPSGAVLYVYMSATGTAAAINASSMSTASVLTVSGFYVI
jgi:hypothetical protein